MVVQRCTLSQPDVKVYNQMLIPVVIWLAYKSYRAEGLMGCSRSCLPSCWHRHRETRCSDRIRNRDAYLVIFHNVQPCPVDIMPLADWQRLLYRREVFLDLHTGGLLLKIM